MVVSAFRYPEFGGKGRCPHANYSNVLGASGKFNICHTFSNLYYLFCASHTHLIHWTHCRSALRQVNQMTARDQREF